METNAADKKFKILIALTIFVYAILTLDLMKTIPGVDQNPVYVFFFAIKYALSI